MKIQDRYPYDSTLVGLENIYYPVGNDSFYLNSPCIIAEDRIISTGKTYIVLEIIERMFIQMFAVRLLNAYYKDNLVNLIVRILNTNVVKQIPIDVRDHEFNMLVIGSEEIKGLMRSGSNAKPNYDDMLEFEF